MARGIAAPLAERLAALSVPAENGCIHFTGGLCRGYGHIGLGDGRTGRAHRIAYALARGPIPSGHDLNHLCHDRDLTCEGGVTCLHRRCVNPDHLDPIEKPEHGTHKTHRKSRCTRGHPFDAANTYWTPNGKRRFCRACLRMRSTQAWRQRAGGPIGKGEGAA